MKGPVPPLENGMCTHHPRGAGHVPGIRSLTLRYPQFYLSQEATDHSNRTFRPYPHTETVALSVNKQFVLSYICITMEDLKIALRNCNFCVTKV